MYIYIYIYIITDCKQNGTKGDLGRWHPPAAPSSRWYNCQWSLLQIPQEAKRDSCVQNRNIHPRSKKCFCFGIPTRIPSSDSVAAGWIRLDQSWCGSSDSAACSGPAAAGCALPSWTLWLHAEMGAGIIQCFTPEQTDRGETSLTSTKFNWICVCVMGVGTGGFSASLQWLDLQTDLYGRKLKATTAVKLENGEIEAINGKCYVSIHHNMV